MHLSACYVPGTALSALEWNKEKASLPGVYILVLLSYVTVKWFTCRSPSTHLWAFPCKAHVLVISDSAMLATVPAGPQEGQRRNFLNWTQSQASREAEAQNNIGLG